MAYRLRDHLHWCECSGRAVFLDVVRDRYFCLSRDANGAFLRLVAGETGSADRNRLNMLVEQGVLFEDPAATRLQSPAAIEPPTCDLAAAHRPHMRHIVRALVAEVCAAWTLRRWTFSQVLEAARIKGSRSRRPIGEPDEFLENVVAGANAASFVSRAHNRCLIRALAVYSICKRHGIPAKLVFGVIAHPFAAHCWVQLRSEVLVGSFEQARLYRPILVIE